MTTPKPRRFTADEMDDAANALTPASHAGITLRDMLRQAASDLRRLERVEAVAAELAGALGDLNQLVMKKVHPGEWRMNEQAIFIAVQEALSRYKEETK